MISSSSAPVWVLADANRPQTSSGFHRRHVDYWNVVRIGRPSKYMFAVLVPLPIKTAPESAPDYIPEGHSGRSAAQRGLSCR